MSRYNGTAKSKALGDIVLLADSGTWGDAGSSENGAPVLRSTNIKGFRLDLSEPAWRVIPGNDLERRRLHTGDIIVTKSSGSPDHIGKCCLFMDPEDGHDYYFSNFMLRLRTDNEKLDYRWLFYWLTSERGRFELARMNSTTSGLRNLSVPRYLEQQIPLPPLAEQKRIAAILDKADGIRRRQQETARLTDKLTTSLFYETFGDPGTNPKNFPVLHMEEIIAETQYGTAAKANTDGIGLPVLRMNNITSEGSFNLADMKWADLSEEEIDKFTVRSGDLLFNRTNSRELVGKTAVWMDKECFAFAGYLIRVRFEWQRALPEYVSAYLNSSFGKQMLFAKAQPSINMSNISASVLRRMEIMLPPLNLQERFVGQVARFRENAERGRRVMGDFDNLFNSLVQRAFRGEL